MVPTNKSEEQSVLSASTERRIRDLLTRWEVPNFGLVVVNGASAPESGESPASSSILLHGQRCPGKAPLFQASDIFAIASNSKFITALALSLLLEELQGKGHRLPNGTTPSWDSRLVDVLPSGLELQDKDAQAQVTLEKMLSMQWGMPRHDRAHRFVPPMTIPAQLAHFRPSAQPGETYQYCNLGPNLVPYIFDRLLGAGAETGAGAGTETRAQRTDGGLPQPRPGGAFVSFVQDRLFTPLGMNTATYDFASAYGEGRQAEGALRMGVDRARGAEELRALGLRLGQGAGHGGHEDGEGARADEWIRRGRPVPDCLKGRSVGIGPWADWGSGSDAGAGGVGMSMNDMVKWTRALLSPPAWLAPHVQRCTTPLISDGPALPLPHNLAGPGHYGLGQKIWRYRGHLVHSHGGHQHGQTSWMARLPERGIGVCVVTGEGGYASELVRIVSLSVIDELLGVTPESESAVDWESAVLLDPDFGTADRFEARPRPEHATPDTSDAALCGTYHNRAYGPLTVTRAGDMPELDPALRDILAKDFREDAADITALASSCLATRLDSVFDSHLLFLPWSGPIYRWIAAAVLPRSLKSLPLSAMPAELGATFNMSDGANDHLWQTSTMGGDEPAWTSERTGLCVRTRGGLGMFDNFWGGAESVAKRIKDEWAHGSVPDEKIKSEAEVWFDLSR